jgi:hypothetical protein
VRLDATLDKASRGTLVAAVSIGGALGNLIATSSYGNSLRIATFNTMMLPSSFNAGTDPAVAQKMVDRILAAGYDVIALNEVFDEDIKPVFVDGLKATFPHYVSELDADFTLEDSALMLFSRLPFADPVTSLHDPESDDCDGSDCNRVRFHEFEACDDTDVEPFSVDDCDAAKGIGYVRLREPATGWITNLWFTHMQAAYVGEDDDEEAEDHVNTRERQAGEAQDMYVDLRNALPNLDTEDSFLLGDLNIDGDLDNPLMSSFNVENNLEWRRHFDDNQSFWTTHFRDGWAFDHSPDDGQIYDRGLTNRFHWGEGSQGARLDYVLHVPTDTCVQHMTLAHNLRWSPASGPFVESGMGPPGIGLAGVEKLSDHLGVNADVNICAQRSRPTDALVVATAPGAPQAIAGQIQYQGSMQWFRFEEEGTYSFAVTSPNGVDFRVYQADDLSTPIPNFKALTTTIGVPGSVPVQAAVFRIPRAPFYVRVFHPSRHATGGFSLIALEHDCASKEFACALGPAEQRVHELGANPPINAPDEAWFVGVPEALDAGAQADLTFLVDAVDPAGDAVFDVDLEDEGGAALAAAHDPEPDPDGVHSRFRVELQDGDGTHHYVRVRRAPAGGLAPPYPPAASRFRVWWQTNLTFLFGTEKGGDAVEIYCAEENDPTGDDGDDEIYFNRLEVDGAVPICCVFYVADFDASNRKGLEGILHTPIPFVSSLVFRFFEEDGGAHGDDDTMSATVGTLAADDPGPALGLHQSMVDQDGDGKYILYYNLTHGFDD